eukprot:m.163683 g.163683  ORF g.163683 m.163683 type:complete len:798 (+) comp16558_c0_seq1:104-2497(+)
MAFPPSSASAGARSYSSASRPSQTQAGTAPTINSNFSFRHRHPSSQYMTPFQGFRPRFPAPQSTGRPVGPIGYSTTRPTGHWRGSTGYANPSFGLSISDGRGPRVTSFKSPEYKVDQVVYLATSNMSTISLARITKVPGGDNRSWYTLLLLNRKHDITVKARANQMSLATSATAQGLFLPPSELFVRSLTDLGRVSLRQLLQNQSLPFPVHGPTTAAMPTASDITARMPAGSTVSVAGRQGELSAFQSSSSTSAAPSAPIPDIKSNTGTTAKRATNVFQPSFNTSALESVEKTRAAHRQAEIRTTKKPLKVSLNKLLNLPKSVFAGAPTPSQVGVAPTPTSTSTPNLVVRPAASYSTTPLRKVTQTGDQWVTGVKAPLPMAKVRISQLLSKHTDSWLSTVCEQCSQPTTVKSNPLLSQPQSFCSTICRTAWERNHPTVLPPTEYVDPLCFPTAAENNEPDWQLRLREAPTTIHHMYEPGDCILSSEGNPAVVHMTSFNADDESMLWISMLTLTTQAAMDRHVTILTATAGDFALGMAVGQPIKASTVVARLPFRKEDLIQPVRRHIHTIDDLKNESIGLHDRIPSRYLAEDSLDRKARQSIASVAKKQAASGAAKLPKSLESLMQRIQAAERKRPYRGACMSLPSEANPIALQHFCARYHQLAVRCCPTQDPLAALRILFKQLPESTQAHYLDQCLSISYGRPPVKRHKAKDIDLAEASTHAQSVSKQRSVQGKRRARDASTQGMSAHQRRLMRAKERQRKKQAALVEAATGPSAFLAAHTSGTTMISKAIVTTSAS